LVPCSCWFLRLGWFVFLQPLTASLSPISINFSTSRVCFGTFSPRSLLLPWRGACFHSISVPLLCLFASVACVSVTCGFGVSLALFSCSQGGMVWFGLSCTWLLPHTTAS
jgi:hypothetical protein